jgi:hypothetical protein
MFDDFSAGRLTIKMSVDEKSPSLLAGFPFFVEYSSTIGTASAVVLRSSFGPMFVLIGASPL